MTIKYYETMSESDTIFPIVPIPMVTVPTNQNLLIKIPPLGSEEYTTSVFVEDSCDTPQESYKCYGTPITYTNIEPYWNESPIKQVLGRAVRSRCHEEIPCSVDNLIEYIQNDNGIVCDKQLLLDSLEQVKEIPGQESLKSAILTHIRNLIDQRPTHAPHTVISGPSGDTKILIASILAQIWTSFNIVGNSNYRVPMRIVSRNELIGKYVHHTHMRTLRCLEESTPVLMIDESHTLMSNPDDILGAESLRTINEYLERNNDCPTLIIDSSLNYLQSLRRKFIFRLKLDEEDIDNVGPDYTSLNTIGTGKTCAALAAFENIHRE